LNALSGGRIDLGIGRAPGGGPLESFALRRERRDSHMPNDFGAQLTELLAYLDGSFEAEDAFGRIRMSPDTPSGASVWLLGSSLWSSRAAAQLGLPYAFAHFFGGEVTRAAITQYQSTFTPSRHRARPVATVAVNAICAPSRAEAEHLASGWRLMQQRLRRTGDAGPVVSPDRAELELRQWPPAPEPETEWPAIILGTPESVYTEIDQMARALSIDEVFVVTITFDPALRLRSYQLLARQAGLTPRRSESRDAIGESLAPVR
jgi:luciferase family oxidoreductase group 1